MAATRREILSGIAGSGTALALAQSAQAQGVPAGPPPREWIDPKTGHRVVRLSDDAGANKLYFYRSMFTPQGDLLVMSARDSIVAVDLKTRKLRTLLADPKARLLFTGRKTRTAYYSVSDPGEGVATARGSTLFALNIDTCKSRKLAHIDNGQFGSLNCDETMIVGTVAYGDRPLQPNQVDGSNRRFGQSEYFALGPDGKPLNFAKAKGVRMLERWSQRLPMELFVVDLATGTRRVIHKSQDWLNHPQFSTTDPNQIIFSHEGPWHRVTRMWRIRADGTGLEATHQRTMNFEIWGHEWFSPDGKWLYYDLQTPRGQVFWVAGLEFATGKRVWRRMDQNSWSVHFNVSPDGKTFAGDGGDADMVAHAPDGKWIVLLRPEQVTDADVEVYDDKLVTPEYLRPERLVDMSAHDYRLEPNITFTPDGKWIVFGSNMHGKNHVYMVEVAKAG